MESRGSSELVTENCYCTYNMYYVGKRVRRRRRSVLPLSCLNLNRFLITIPSDKNWPILSIKNTNKHFVYKFQIFRTNSRVYNLRYFLYPPVYSIYIHPFRLYVKYIRKPCRLQSIYAYICGYYFLYIF